MRGSISRKGDRYYVVIEEERDPGTGKRRRTWHSGFATRDEAQQRLAVLVTSKYRGGYVEPSRLTFGDWLDEEWLPAARPTLKASTGALYETLVTAYVKPRLGAVPLQKLRAADLNRFYGDLLANGRIHGEGGLSATSVRNIHRLIHRALRDAVRWDLIARNPAEVSDPPRTKHSDAKAWTAAQVATFIASTTDDEHATLWLLLATSGCRRGEALGLTWEDVNFDARRITIRRSLSYAGRVAVLEEPKTARSRRSVAIPAKTVMALKAHRSRQAETRLAVGPDYDPRGFVFAKPDGTPLTPATATRRFKRLASTLNLPELSIHGLRHSYATIALESGVPAKVTQEQLGHSSIATTLDIYSHAVPGLQEDAAETVAALLFGES